MKRRMLLKGVASTSLVGLAGCLGETQYTVSDAKVSQSEDLPLQLDLTIVDPDAVIQGPAKLKFTLKNITQNPIRIQNSGVWPLGVLNISSQSGGGSVTLWNQAYNTSSNVNVKSRSSFSVSGTPITRSLGGGKTISSTYEIYGNDVAQGGKFNVHGKFQTSLLEYETPGEKKFKSFEPTVTLSIQKRGIVPNL